MGFVRHALGYFYPELIRSYGDNKSLENPNTPLSAVFDVPRTSSGISVSEDGSMAISTVYACVKVIAETMALMDIEVKTVSGKFKKHDPGHPNNALLLNPSPYFNRFEYISTSMYHVLLWGNSYSWIKRNRYGEAKELQILPPWEVTPKMTATRRLFYEWTHNNSTDIIRPEDILHTKNISCDGIIGLSPIAVQRENLGNALAKSQHEGAFYSNGAKASGVLMTPGNMGVKERKNVEESFNKLTNGPKNRFTTVVLEEGVRYQQLTIPQNDSQFLESKKFERSEIAGWFRVPPYKIGDHEKATYSNIEGQERSFAKDTIVPWAIRVQQEFNRKLLFTDEIGLTDHEFNLDDLIKGDMKTRYEIYQLGINGGILKPIEVREQEGWSTDNMPEIDDFFMNGANRTVKQIQAGDNVQTAAA